MTVSRNGLWSSVSISAAILGSVLSLGPMALSALSAPSGPDGHENLVIGSAGETGSLVLSASEAARIVSPAQKGPEKELSSGSGLTLPGGLDPMDVVRTVETNRERAARDALLSAPLETPDELGPPFHIGGSPSYWAAGGIQSEGDQRCPAVASDGSSYLVVWHDNRSGTWDIYGARVSLSATVIDPAGIEVSRGSQDEQYPSVAFDGTNYLVVWQDNRGGSDWDIYGARVATSGIVLDPDGKAISAVLNDQSYPSVAFGGSDYLVVWQDKRSCSANFYGDIYGARVDQSGDVMGAAIVVSEAADDQSNPDVAFGGSDYLVVWQDRRSGSTYDIYRVRVDQSGNVIDTGIPISEADDDQSYPAVAFGGSKYMVVWQDERNGSDDIYAARVDVSGILDDTTGIVISTVESAQRSPDVAFDGTNFMVVWHDYRISPFVLGIYGARITTSGNVLDPSGIAICTGTGDGGTYYPALAFGGTNYFVAWGREQSGYTDDVYGARVGSSGTVLEPCGAVVSKSANNQYYPAVAFGSTGYLVVWLDNRLGSWKLYAARVGTLGTVLDLSGIELPAAVNSSSEPSVASDGTDYLVVWTDYRSDPYGDIYGARVSAAGVVLDPGGIALPHGSSEDLHPSVAFGITNYLVVWRDSQEHIIGARVSPSGLVLDEEGRTIKGTGYNYRPCVAFDGTNYLVAWYVSDNIQGVLVNTLVEVQDPPGLIPVSSATGSQQYPDMTFDGTNYMVVWQDERGGDFDIYGACVTPAGVVLDPGGIPISTAQGDQEYPAIAFDGTDYLVVWQDGCWGSLDIYGAQMDTLGNVLDPDGLRLTTGAGYERFPDLCSGPAEEIFVTYSSFTAPPVYGSYRIWGSLYSSPPQSADMEVAPAEMSVEIFPASMDTLTIKIANAGTGDLAFSIAEGVSTAMQALEGAASLCSTDSKEQDALLNSPLVDVPWMSESPAAGVVLPGDSVFVDVVFNSTGMSDGTYEAYLVISCNDEDADPTIVPTVMEVSHVFVTSPANGDRLLAWQQWDIRWVTSEPGNVDSLSILYSVDGGFEFDVVSHGEVNDSTFEWTAPNHPSSLCKVEVMAFYSDGKCHQDVNDGLFTIHCGTVDAPGGQNHPSDVVRLWQNRPNPFSGSTDFCFYLPVDQEVYLEVFDAAGRLVAVPAEGKRFRAGVRTIRWDGIGRDGSHLSSGLYFYRLKVGSFIGTKKMVLVR